MRRWLVVAGAVLAVSACAGQPRPGIPVFTSSDPKHDRLLNDLFVRHLRIDASDTSLRSGPGGLAPTVGTVHLWRDWEVDQLLWFDCGPKAFAGEDRRANLHLMLATMPVDRFGYVFTAHDGSLPAEIGPMVYFGMGWPFPDYPQAFGSLAAGWEWNGTGADGWTAERVDSSVVQAGAWTVSSAQRDPALTSPMFKADWIHCPFLFLDLAVDGMDAGFAARERRFRVYWTTEAEPEFSEQRCVRSDDWPVIPVPSLDKGFARRLWLPMCLHPGWRGQTITRLRFHLLDPKGDAAGRTASMTLKALRLSYDTRHAVNNPILIRAAARAFFWDGDAGRIKSYLPRMRMATEFLLTHLRVRQGGVPDQSWFVGHDGLGHIDRERWRVGHGIGTNYYDILPMGPRDMQSAAMCAQALEAMAQIEDYVTAHPELDSPKPTVSAPDGFGTVAYRETGRSLRAMAARARTAIRRVFWNAGAGRYGGWRNVDGVLKDYGYTHFNCEALAAGVPSPADALSVLDWLSGKRTVAGDTSTGADIYRYGFAARMSTRRNLYDYVWPWKGYDVPWGDQVQDGGAVLFTSFFDVKGRLRYGDDDGAWTVWRRMLDHHSRVLAGGGRGTRFYRDYYAAHPEEGKLQGGGPAGGLGLDEEFVESLLTPAAWATAWLGLDAPGPDVLEIAPTVPRTLRHIGVQGAFYRGNTLNVEARQGVIDLSGSRIERPSSARLRLVFRGAFSKRAVVLRDGRPDPGKLIRRSDRIVLETRLGASKWAVKEGIGAGS